MKLLQDERFLNIIEYLKEHQTATLAELAEYNGVSVDTTRRDIEKLDKDKMVKKVRGGATYHQADITTQRTSVREILNETEKKKIAAALKDYISDGQVIAINSGTTCALAARFLAENYYRLTILTNNLEVMKIASENDGFNVIVPGGLLDIKEDAIYGEQCEKDILEYNADKLILGVHGVSLEKGVTDFRFKQKEVVQAMLKISGERIVVADSDKLGKVSCVNICGLNEIDHIITNGILEPSLKEKYRQAGVNIRSVDE